MISGLGFQEIVVIAVVVLVVFGPKRLPELMRMAGKLTRDLRRLAWEFRSALDLDSLEKDIDTRLDSLSDSESKHSDALEAEKSYASEADQKGDNVIVEDYEYGDSSRD